MSSLQEAREAIQNGNLTAAQAIIADVLKSNQNNAEAWFLLSEATEGDRKLIFLNKALNLDPSLQEAVQRKAELEGTAAPELEPEPDSSPEEEDASFSTIPPADFETFTDLEEEEREEVVSAPAAPPPKQEAAPPVTATQSTNPAESPEEQTAEAASSTLLNFNNIGFALSLALAAVLLLLFIQAVLELF